MADISLWVDRSMSSYHWRLIIRHFDEDELEDYVLMNHPDFLAQMERSYQDAKAEKTTEIDVYLDSLESEDETEDAI